MVLDLCGPCEHNLVWCCVSITGHQRKRQKGGEVTHSFKPFPTGLQREAGKQ